MDSIDKESKLKEIKQNLIRFASKTFKEMKELEIRSLNISNSNAILENNDIGIFRIHFGENDFNEIDEEEVDSKKQSITIKNKKKPLLSSPAITMARNLQELLLNIDKLPDQQSFTMNPTKFTIIESYVQFLLNKLKSSSTKEAFVEELRCNNDNFLEIGLPPNNENLKDNFEITSEVNLLKMEESSFERSKEEIIKALVAQLISIYDNVLQEYIEAEINRRNGFRNYLNFLKIYKKIEIFCNIYKIRLKGQTIKNQTNTKIVDYSEQKIKLTTLTITLRAAKRIDRLLSLSNKNFLIVDIFPNLDVAFFKSSSINVAAYEYWLKIIETGEIISEEQGYEIYQQKKKEENSLRENILKQVYESAGYESAEYYYIDEESPRYYPDNDNPDNEESPRYYPDNEESILPMDES
ncbi:unnamed protein product [Rhizophagus irregularis]|nr:unnamed protein product [Rhizophagus irregularis]